MSARLSPDQFRIGKGRTERWGYIDRLGPCDIVPDADPAHPFEAPAWSTIKKAFPNNALPRWKDGMSAEYFYQHAQELLALPMDEASMKVKNAVAGISTEAAWRGTTAHAVMEAIANGDNPLLMLEPEVLPYLAAMKNFLNDVQPEFKLSEFVVFNRSIGYGATADGTAYIPEMNGLAAFDYKTRKPSDRTPKAYDEEALQVVAAANAEYRMTLNDDGEIARAPIPKVDGGLVILFFPEGIYEIAIVEVGLFEEHDGVIYAPDEVRALRRFYDTFATNAKRLHGLWQPTRKAERLQQMASAAAMATPPAVAPLLAPPMAPPPAPSVAPPAAPAPLPVELLLPAHPVALPPPAVSAPDTAADAGTAEPGTTVTPAPPAPSLPSWATQTVAPAVATPAEERFSPFPFTRERLIARLKKIIEIPEAGAMLAPFPHGVWPAGVPSFAEAAEHSAYDLEKINGALAIIESKYRISFVDVEEPTAAQVAMVERIFTPDPPAAPEADPTENLPPATMDEVRESARALLEDKGVALTPDLIARRALEEVTADKEQIEVIAALAKVDPIATTSALAAERIIVVCKALTAGELILNFVPVTKKWEIFFDGATLLDKLVKQCGGKRQLLDAAKAECAEHGLPAPRSAAAIGENGLLLALLLYPPTP